MTTTRARSLPNPAFFLLFPAALSLALAGCSGSDDATAGAPVASVDQPAGQPATASADEVADQSEAKNPADVEARRPQLRVDTSETEKGRLYQAWGACLKKGGVNIHEKEDENGIRWAFPSQEDRTKNPEAFEACAIKEPILPAATDPKRNPDYSNDFRKYVKCINRDSDIIKVKQTSDGWSYADDYDDAPENVWATFEEVDRACEIEGFGGE